MGLPMLYMCCQGQPGAPVNSAYSADQLGWYPGNWLLLRDLLLATTGKGPRYLSTSEIKK